MFTGKKAKLAITLVLVIGGLIAVRYAVRGGALTPVQIFSDEVRRGAISRQIEASGHIDPVTSVRVSSSLSGDLLALHVQEGKAVSKGDLIAEIDRARQLAIRNQAEASTRSAEAAVRVERAQFGQSELDLKRAKALRSEGIGSEVELERATSRTSVAQARLEAARQRVAQARAALEEAEARLAQSQIVAPIDGTVINLMKKVGERVRGSELAEDVLAIIAPLDTMQVELEVSEHDIRDIALKQDAEIFVDALDDLKVAGAVVEIASSATVKFRGEEREVTSFKVTVGLRAVPKTLRPGMSATVKIVTKTKKDAIIVPIEAVTARPASTLEKTALELRQARRGSIFQGPKEAPVRRRREKPVEIVFVLKDGLADPRRVETGISSDKDIEIVSGLKEGERIAVGPYRALSKSLARQMPIKQIDEGR